MELKADQGKLFYACAAIAGLAYFLLAYCTDRSNFAQLISLVAIVAACSYYIYLNISKPAEILWLGLIFRAIIFIAIPFFSQDFYRFIWDGELILHGVNPYAFTPNELITNAEITFPSKVLLFEKMGSLSARYNSNYPPVNQVFFAAAAMFGGASLFAKTLFLKLFVVAADIGVFFIGKKILQHYKLDEKQIAFYFLNPLVIIELTGNLHFEGVMLFFFLLGIYLLLQKKIAQAALFTSMAIATKLVPLMLLPFLIKKMNWKENVLFFSILAIFAAVTFYVCFGLENMGHYLSSIALWFNNFEFNASIYYICKEIGFAISGYNMIAVFGKLLPAISALIILAAAFINYKNRKDNIFTFMSLGLSAYLLFSTTVHPWYIVTLLGLSIFTNFKFILLWSILIFISYHAYANNVFKETSIGLLLEYVPIYILAFMEIKRFAKNRSLELGSET